MIIGVILNNFKCFEGMHYIPLTNADGINFCGLIGLNGVGKSTVLEALDCFFNHKELLPTIGTEKSYVIPICTIAEREFKKISNKNLYKEELNSIKKISDALKCFIDAEIPPECPGFYKDTLINMQNHWKKISTIDNYILPLNWIFFTLDRKFLAVLGNPQKNFFFYSPSFMQDYLDSYTFVYVPTNLAPKDFAIFETEQMLRLLCIDLSNIEDKLKKEYKTIKKADQQLNSKIDYLSRKMTKYQFTRMSVTEEKRVFFEYINSRLTKYKLKKVIGEIEVPLSQSSSGEQKQAIMDLIYQIVKDQSNRNLIVAIDEPESSFHISERFEQFNKLYEISKNCGQVLFTSHWYGFIPSIPDGCIVNIMKEADQQLINIFDIYKYKEEITRAKYPVDIMLKGNSDLIQTLLCSVLIDNCYNWLICEGTSDKIYLEEYLNDEIDNHKLRIVPVGGCDNIKKIYNHLALSLSELKNDVKGKIYLLVDTDENKKYEKLALDTSKIELFLRFKRLVNIKNETKLEDFGSVLNSPTDIEGVLNGKAFNNALNKFKDELPFVTEDIRPEIPSAFALDLRGSGKEQLKVFFTPTNKVRFARAYVEEIQKGGYKVPNWIEEIRKFFKS